MRKVSTGDNKNVLSDLVEVAPTEPGSRNTVVSLPRNLWGKAILPMYDIIVHQLDLSMMPPTRFRQQALGLAFRT